MQTLVRFGLWCLLAVFCVVAYWPGLSGPFVFDDFASLAQLGNFGGVRDWDTFIAFVFGGNSGPTGRPLALLTFLIDASNWPADPWPFKRTNLIIHLLNGAMLGLLMRQVLAFLDFGSRKASFLALVAAGFWLLHPFLVSTTLYAVQRMAQLSTLFVFAGLVGYVRGRALLPVSPRKAYLLMSASIVFGTLLSTMSKENGILLPVLVGVFEATVAASRRHQVPSISRLWITFFVAVPSCIIIAYLGQRSISGGFFATLPYRDYSGYERLLTQARVLLDYQRHWFLPELYTTGVFQDHFVKSSGLVSPLSTLFSIVFHVLLISLAMLRRRRWPLFSFAVFFFYASHLLESTVLNLELYFEHRNYLAAAFLALPVVDALQRYMKPLVFLLVSPAVLLTLAGFTRYSSTVWSDYEYMVEASAEKAPTSARAQQQLANNLYNAGRPDEALAIIDRTISFLPSRPELMLTRSTMLCRLGRLQANDFDRLARVVTSQPYDQRSYNFYMSFLTSVIESDCLSESFARLKQMFLDMLQEPLNADPESLRYSRIQFFIGLVDVQGGEPSLAVDAFEESLRARPGAGHAMLMAALFASNAYYNEALLFSDRALSDLGDDSNRNLSDNTVNAQDILEFQANVREEMAAGR